MASEGMVAVSLASVVEDVLKQHGTKLSDVNLASRKAGEAGERLLLCFSLYPFPFLISSSRVPLILRTFPFFSFFFLMSFSVPIFICCCS